MEGAEGSGGFEGSAIVLEGISFMWRIRFCSSFLEGAKGAIRISRILVLNKR